MTAPEFMDRARALDRDLEFLDALRDAALRTAAHPKIAYRLLARRNELSRQWSEAWGCRKVEP